MWKCKECGKKSNEITVVPGVCGGEVVDILDYFCSECTGGVTWEGTPKEKEAWWDEYIE